MAEPVPPSSACCLCGGFHPRCRFAAGSLYCITPGCGNPHHLTRGGIPAASPGPAGAALTSGEARARGRPGPGSRKPLV